MNMFACTFLIVELPIIHVYTLHLITDNLSKGRDHCTKMYSKWCEKTQSILNCNVSFRGFNVFFVHSSIRLDLICVDNCLAQKVANCEWKVWWINKHILQKSQGHTHSDCVSSLCAMVLPCRCLCYNLT